MGRRVHRDVLARALTGKSFIVKAASEQRYVLGVAYPAGWRDSIHKGQDGYRDWMSEAEVEKAAWNYLAGGRQIGLSHVDGTVGKATVVESYVWRFEDARVIDTQGSSQTIRKGDWIVGAVLDEPTWADYKAGKYTGWSVQGAGRRRRA